MDGVNLGYSEMDEFNDIYGPYAEITYIISNGDVLKFNEIFKMNVMEYLFLGEYLLRKRKIESKKTLN